MAPQVLTFDEGEHRYYLDGEELPSVSKIKEPLVDFSMVAPDVLARASRFGKAVHKMAELHLLGRLDYGSLDEALYGPLAAFEKWLKEVRPFQSGPAIIDVKSRLYDRVADPIQVSGGYYTLWKENREELGTDPIVEKPLASIRYRYAGTPDIIIPPQDGAEDFFNHRVLYLGRDGRYQYPQCYDRNAWPVFGHLLGDYYRAITTKQIIQSWRSR